MSSNPSTKYFYSEFNKGIPIFRIIFLYGCYSKKQIMEKTGKGAQAYQQEIGRLKQYFSLPNDITSGEDSSHKEIENRKGIYYTKYRRYEDQNFLCIFYHLRKSEPTDLYDYYHFLLGKDEDISDKRKRRELRAYFNETEKGEKEKTEGLNESLTEREQKELSNALLFFAQKAPFSVPGYFLYQKLNNRIESNFIFQYANIYRVFDDRYVYKIFYAIKKGYHIKLTYEDTTKTVIPLRLKHEYYCGRTYFQALVYYDSGYSLVRMFRVDKIESLSFCDPVSVIEPSLEEDHSLLSVDHKRKPYKVKVNFRNIQLSRLKQIVSTVSAAGVDESAMTWEIQIDRYRDLIPFLRRYAAVKLYDSDTYVPCAQVDKDISYNLYNNLKKDFEDALKKYERAE